MLSVARMRCPALPSNPQHFPVPPITVSRAPPHNRHLAPLRPTHPAVTRSCFCSPQQQARILAAWKGFEAELQLLNTQRRRLCAQLAGLGRYLAWLPANVQFKNAVKSSLTREAGLSSLLLSDDHDDILMALQANMVGRPGAGRHAGWGG